MAFRSEKHGSAKKSLIRGHTSPTIIGLQLIGAIAQMGERLHGMQEVGGSIPPGSTSL